MPTPSGFTTREIGISGGGDHHHSLEAAPMATTLTSECNLLVIPFSAATNFTTLADYCEHFAETIIECHDLALKMAPCGRLSTCLALLRPTLGEPIPPHLIDRFTVDVLPDVLPEFTPDADLLCDYCLAPEGGLEAPEIPLLRQAVCTAYSLKLPKPQQPATPA